VYQPRPGTAYAVVTQEGRTAIATVQIQAQGAGFGYTAVGRLDMPAEFPLPDGTTWVPCEEPGVLPQLEGLSVDQRNGVLYAAQEDVGVWRIQLPLGSSRPVLIDRVADFGVHDLFDEESEECGPVDEDDTGFGGPNLVADAEGVDVYYGHGATGYVIVSSQGDDRYAVYSTTGTTARSAPSSSEASAWTTSTAPMAWRSPTALSAGIAKGFSSATTNPRAAPGVDQDRDPTNFSLVDWGDVANALHLQVSTNSRNDPRFR
jgi:3-phytase